MACLTTDADSDGDGIQMRPKGSNDATLDSDGDGPASLISTAMEMV